MVSPLSTPSGVAPMLQSDMADEAVIRKQNLVRYCREHKPPLAATDLAELLGSRVSLWADLLAGRKPSFGEKLARRIEEGLGLPRGYLDQVHDGEAPASRGPDLTPDERRLLLAFRTVLREDRTNTLAAIERRAREVAELREQVREEAASAAPASPSRKRAGAGG